MYKVVLDACVLFPSVLRDTLLSIAEQELFHPQWSEQILDEVRRSVIAKRNVDPIAFDRTLALMNNSFDGAVVENWKHLVDGLKLPDPDDRHVLAAAIAGGSQTIVTFNLVDFPTGLLEPHHIDAVHPDAFLLDQLDLAPARVLGALAKQARRFRNPAMDLSGLLARLERCGVPEFTDEVRRMAL
ncbi:PIN domain-containing protein [Solihabitans fulvus]|uniref:PIN domain-containing protein n=1 Tax=Solihabitans fulvus TaxID=1892852 RepID=A0A5B2WVB2_9PSEU|nr:PIN domain-containing protein [Solihabitans fulvus]KAA2255641.1 PIN domain-containing protein [Solihabitans fulvus]